MPTTKDQPDLNILRGLIDCLRLYEQKKDSFAAAQQDSPWTTCSSSDGIRSFQETRRTMLETLEKGLTRLSYDYLGIKLRIAVVLAREDRGEEVDVTELREQLENALAYAGSGDEALPHREVGLAPSMPNRDETTVTHQP